MYSEVRVEDRLLMYGAQQKENLARLRLEREHLEMPFVDKT